MKALRDFFRKKWVISANFLCNVAGLQKNTTLSSTAFSKLFTRQPTTSRSCEQVDLFSRIVWLQSMGSQRVGHDWATSLSLFTFTWDLDGKESACSSGDMGLIPRSGRSPGERNGNPLQYSCLENSMGRGAWWAIILGVRKSQTRLSDSLLTLIYLNAK